MGNDWVQQDANSGDIDMKTVLDVFDSPGLSYVDKAIVSGLRNKDENEQNIFFGDHPDLEYLRKHI
jgi:hypothetical protein